jgi:hypothetical protein
LMFIQLASLGHTGDALTDLGLFCSNTTVLDPSWSTTPAKSNPRIAPVVVLPCATIPTVEALEREKYTR